MIKLLKRYFKSYRVSLILTLILTLFQVVFQLLLPQLTDNILKNGVAANDMGYIYRTGAFMLAMTVLVGLCMLGVSYSSAVFAGKFTSGCRQEMFHKVCYSSQTQFGKYGSSTLSNRFTNDLPFLALAIMMLLRNALSTPLIGIGAIIIIFTMNVPLSLILLAGFVLSIVYEVYAMKRTQPMFRSGLAALDRLNLLAKEKLGGVRTIRAFNRQDAERVHTDEAIERVYQLDLHSYNSISAMVTLIQLVMNIVLVIVFYMSSGYVRQGIMGASDLVKYVQYIVNFIASVSSISNIIQWIPRSQLCAGRILEIVDQDVSDEENESDAAAFIDAKKGEVVFDHVTYGYEGADRSVLNDLSFHISPGETAAFIGTTGSGKTTLISLILGLYRNYSGSVSVNGCENKGTSRKSLSSAISYAPQKSRMLQKSILNNLKLSDEDITDQEAEKALSMACINDLVQEKEEKLNFMIDQGGMNVSGGQRQRLSLARAVAKDADIYIFDDSFSALDAKTEVSARCSILRYLKENKKTAILVSQRIKTIMDADRIYLIDNGRIAGEGTHRQLLEQNALYREIYQTQFHTAV